MKTNTSSHKLKVINFYHDYGLKPTIEAFNVKRSTIFLWKKQYHEGNHCIEALNNKNTKPKIYRMSNIDERIKDFIKEQRYQHKRIGKDKLKSLLDDYCNSLNIKSISVQLLVE